MSTDEYTVRQLRAILKGYDQDAEVVVGWGFMGHGIDHISEARADGRVVIGAAHLHPAGKPPGPLALETYGARMEALGRVDEALTAVKVAGDDDLDDALAALVRAAEHERAGWGHARAAAQ